MTYFQRHQLNQWRWEGEYFVDLCTCYYITGVSTLFRMRTTLFILYIFVAPKPSVSLVNKYVLLECFFVISII